MARKATQDRGRTEQLSSQLVYRAELGSQAAVRQAKKEREADDKKWAAEEMQMLQEVVKQEEELKRIQSQVQKREMANTYATQIGLARQGKEDKQPSFNDRSRAEAVDRWISDSKDEVANRALQREQREAIVRRNKQSATNEALRVQVEEKKQREAAAKAHEREQAAAYLRRANEAKEKEVEEASSRQYQKQLLSYELDMQRGAKVAEPRNYVDAFTAGQHINKENTASDKAVRPAEFKPAYKSSPYATDAVEQVSRKPVQRTSVPYAVYEDTAPASKHAARPRESVPYALHDELGPIARAHPADIPGVPRNLTAYQRAQYDIANPPRRTRN